MKLLLYCTKQPLYLVRNENDKYYYTMDKGTLNDYKNVETYNGKIVAECDFEVEEIENNVCAFCDYKLPYFETKTLDEKEIEERSCLSYDKLKGYLQNSGNGFYGYSGYAIHIKNLNIYDKPKELSDYYIIQNEHANPIDIEEDIKTVKKAPQNMMYCWDFIQEYRIFKKKIIISIRPEWLVKILNGEKTIEVRKKVLKEMLGNETR